MAGLTLSGVVGVVITHEHGDHSSGASRFLRKFDAPVLTSSGTWRSLQGHLPEGTRHHIVGLTSTVEVGPFRIDACPISHDAAEPLAILVRAGGATIGVAYDLGRSTTAVRYLLRDCTALILEANHDDVQLRTSGYPPVVQQRIAGSGGHLSNRAAAEMIGGLLHPGLELVVLAHLSERCNSEACARAAVEPVLRKAKWPGSLHVARQDYPLAALSIPRPMVLSFEF